MNEVFFAQAKKRFHAREKDKFGGFIAKSILNMTSLTCSLRSSFTPSGRSRFASLNCFIELADVFTVYLSHFSERVFLGLKCAGVELPRASLVSNWLERKKMYTDTKLKGVQDLYDNFCFAPSGRSQRVEVNAFTIHSPTPKLISGHPGLGAHSLPMWTSTPEGRTVGIREYLSEYLHKADIDNDPLCPDADDYPLEGYDGLISGILSQPPVASLLPPIGDDMYFLEELYSRYCSEFTYAPILCQPEVDLPYKGAVVQPSRMEYSVDDYDYPSINPVNMPSRMLLSLDVETSYDEDDPTLPFQS